MNSCGCPHMLVDGRCYFHLKLSAGLLGSNGHGGPLTEEQLAFIGVYGTRTHEPGWMPAADVVSWLGQDDREPEIRGIRYSVTLAGTSWELSV